MQAGLDRRMPEGLREAAYLRLRDYSTGVMGFQLQHSGLLSAPQTRTHSYIAAALCNSNNFLAVSTPKTGKRSSVNKPICFNTEAWSQ